MDELLKPMISGGIVGGIVGFLGVLLVGFLRPRTFCQKCQNPLPYIRKPTSIRQGIKGGWNCKNCGAIVSRDGNLLSKDSAESA